MDYSSEFTSEKERLDFLMNLNEVYFGKTDSIKAIEDQLRKIRHRYIRSKRKPINDPDIIKLNHMIEKQFGFGKFELLVTFDPIPNAATIPIEYSFNASKKQNSYMVDVSSYKFKREYDYKCIVVMTTGLIFNDYFSTEEVMACLLYELGRNFYVCFTDNNAILSNIYMAGAIANTISDTVQQFMFTKSVINLTAGIQSNVSRQRGMKLLDIDPDFSVIKNDPDMLKDYIDDVNAVSKGIEQKHKMYGSIVNILLTLDNLFESTPIYRELQSKMQKNYHNHKPTKRAMYDFCDYLGMSIKYAITKTFTTILPSLKEPDDPSKILQHIDIVNLLVPYKQFIARAMNPLTYLTMPADYKVERAANNFPTMYGYGAAEASYFGKMQCNDKVKLVNHFLKKNPGISILFDAVTLPSKVLNGVFDPSPSGISKCYDQLKLLKHELAKEDLSPEMKEILIRDISELEKQIRKLMDISNGVSDPNIAKHLYNKALGDILNGVGLKDKLFDDRDKFKNYDKNFNSKVQFETAIGWSCNHDQLLSEGVISNVIDHQKALNNIRQQWKQATGKFVTHRWIQRFITPKQEEMLKKYYENLVKEDVEYSDYKKSFNFICKFMGIDNKDVMIEHLEFKQDEKDKQARICDLCYSKGRVKIKIPEGLSLIHVSPVEGIDALNPSFRNKKLGHYMYPSKRVFFTIEKDIKAKNASLSGQKLYRYRAKNIQYAYIDPTCNTFNDRAVYVDTDKAIPVERYEKFLDKLFNTITGNSIKQGSTINEVAFDDFIDDLKNWKTHNEGNPRPEFVSNNISDADFMMLQDLIDHMHNDVDYTDYKKAFDKFCKYCHIVPRGTIIYSHNLVKGKEPNHNFLKVVYAYNTKKIEIPEGTVLYHMSKVEGIKELKPFFRGKKARGFLYDKPRIYLTLNKNMIKMFADYKPSEKMYKYVVTQPIKNAYVDPLVPGIINKAIYIESNKPIPVVSLDEYAKTHDVQKEALINFATENQLQIIEEENDMAIKYIDVEQESYLAPVTEGNIVELIKKKIISIIEKIEEFLDRLLFKLREQTANVKKYKDVLLKNSNAVDDIELDVLTFKESEVIDILNINFDTADVNYINSKIQALEKFSPANISNYSKKSTISQIGGIGALINGQEQNAKEYLKLKQNLRNTKRSLNATNKIEGLDNETHSLLIKMFNMYKQVMTNTSLITYRNNNAAIIKAINKVKSIKEYALSGISDEFDAFMESNFGLSESSVKTDYKTVDISDGDGVDITDTIKGNFDNWEGIIPDDTIGDITAEFDSFLEATFGTSPPQI